jgi:5S rRNA maturation endonuclease (ribonuclease M5)
MCGASKKFYWNVDNGIGYCQSGSCPGKKVIGWTDFEKAYAGQLVFSDDPASHKTYRSSKKGLDTANLRFQNAWESDKGRAFLQSRGISEVESRVVPIWWIEESQSLAIDAYPVSPEYPTEVLYRCLDWEDHKWIALKGVSKSLYIWGADYWLKAPEPYLIVCEGMFDVLSTGLLGKAIAVLGSSIKEACGAWFWWLAKERGTKIYIWTDADKAGEKARLEIKTMLNSYAVESEYIEAGKDPKNYTRDEVKRLLSCIERNL